jgi:hypothetical protein
MAFVRAIADPHWQVAHAELIGGRYFDTKRSPGNSRLSAGRSRGVISRSKSSAAWRWSMTCGSPACCMHA